LSTELTINFLCFLYHYTGVGQKAKTAIVYAVRLDFDPNSLDVKNGKSIHFNAAKVPGQKEGRLAAVVGPSLGITKEAAQKMYSDWLKELQDPGMTAPYLWNSWYSGQHAKRQLVSNFAAKEEEEDIEITESTAVDITEG